MPSLSTQLFEINFRKHKIYIFIFFVYSILCREQKACDPDQDPEWEEEDSLVEKCGGVLALRVTLHVGYKPYQSEWRDPNVTLIVKAILNSDTLLKF